MRFEKFEEFCLKSPRKDEVVCEMCFVWQNWKYVNRSNKQPSMLLLLLLLLRWSIRAQDGGPSKRQRLLVVGGEDSI